LAKPNEETALFLILTSLFITGGVVLLTQFRKGWLGLAVGLLFLIAWMSHSTGFCGLEPVEIRENPCPEVY
jgi:hypothetical protein